MILAYGSFGTSQCSGTSFSLPQPDRETSPEGEAGLVRLSHFHNDTNLWPATGEISWLVD